MTAVGVPMADRGRRTDEYLDAMTPLWTQRDPAFTGEYVSFENVDAQPRPQALRVAVGGHSQAAFRRAVSRANGWFGNGTADDLGRHLDGCRRVPRAPREAQVMPAAMSCCQISP